MKKLITICFILATSFTIKAQDMNFEETVKYINDKIICCSKYENLTITATISGDILWGNHGERINLFDLVPEVDQTEVAQNSQGIKLDIHGYIWFSGAKTGSSLFNQFSSEVDAERMFKAFLHLKSLCTKKKDPFDN